MANLNTSISPSPVITSLTKGRTTATGYTGNVTMALDENPSNATLGGTLTVASVAGVATFANLTLNRSGIGFTLRATGAAQGGVTPRAVVSRPFSIATTLVFTTQPTGVAAPDDILPLFVVTAQDSLGATDTSYNGEVTVSLYTGAGSGILGGLFTRNAISGIADFSGLSIDSAGLYSLLAEGGESTIAAKPSAKVSGLFSVGLAMEFTAQPVDAQAGAVMSPVVITVKDSVGNTQTNFTGNVSIAILNNPSGGVLSGTVTVAAVAGVATFSTLSIDAIGDGYTFQASSTGIPNSTSAAFDITGYIFTVVLMPSMTEYAAFPYDIPPNGDIQPPTFGGVQIQSFGTSSSPVESFMSWVTAAPVGWTGITINGVTLMRADAIGETPYTWAGQAVLVAAGTYQAVIF